MSNKQQGAALVIVLALLTGAMIVGVSGMQSSLIDERLAGNYRATTLSQMAAEDVAGYIQKNYGSLPVSDDIGKNIEDWSVMAEGVFPKDEDVTLRRSYYECLSVNSAPCKSTNKSYEENAGSHLPIPFYIARGEVLEGEDGDPVAEHLVVVGRKAGGNGGSDLVSDNLPDGLFDYALLVGGALAINGGANISGTVRVAGSYRGNKNKDEIEDLRDLDNINIINDYRSGGGLDPNSNNGFMEKIKKYLGYADDGSQCLDNDEYNVKYCYGDASLNLEDIEGKQVVVEGEATIKGKVDAEESTVIIAEGNVTFKGMGGSSFKGFVWSGGSLVFKGQGGAQYEGSFVSAGSSTFNGGLNIKPLPFEARPGKGQEGYIWQNL